MPSPATPYVMDEKETQMKYSDLYFELTNLTPDELKKPVLFYDTLTGATYEPKKVAKSEDGDEIVITF